MIEKLLKQQTDKTSVQLFRYAFTGPVSFIVDFYSLLILTEVFKVFYLVSVPIAYILGIFTNYFICTAWVFNKKTDNSFWYDFGIFTIIGLIGLVFLEMFMWFFTDHLHFHYLYSKIVSTCIVALWNFFARKAILFSNSAQEELE